MTFRQLEAMRKPERDASTACTADTTLAAKMAASGSGQRCPGNDRRAERIRTNNNGKNTEPNSTKPNRAAIRTGTGRGQHRNGRGL